MEQHNSNMRGLPQKPTLSFLLVFFILFMAIILALGIFSKVITVKNYLHLISDFVFAPKSKIASYEGRVNILILGKSGEGYTAPDLTDTVMFASVSLVKPSVILISLPRDIWIPEIRAKLNSAYYWGRPKDEGGGLILAKSIVQNITGKPVHYGVVLDFSAFTKITDALGGIEVEVERSFIDNKYPIAGRENDLCNGDKEYKCRYETVRFEKGRQLMNGEVALKFVRSRNAEGEEGTDLAREGRQQKVIIAVKRKILSFSTIFSPKRIIKIWKILNTSIESDADLSAAAILGRKMLSFRKSITTHVIPEDLLIHPPVSAEYDKQYVFIPKAGDWSEFQNWIKDLIK